MARDPWEMTWGSWERIPKEGSVGFEYHLLLEASELPRSPSPSAPVHTCLLGHLLLCFLLKDQMFAFGLDRYLRDKSQVGMLPVSSPSLEDTQEEATLRPTYTQGFSSTCI